MSTIGSETASDSGGATSEPDIVNFVQINLGKGKAATSHVSKFSIENKVKIIFIQEPNTRKGAIVGFGAGFSKINSPNVERPRAGIILNDGHYRPTLLSHLSNEFIAAAEVITDKGFKFNAVSVYLPPADSRLKHNEQDVVRGLNNCLRELAANGPLMIAGDFNARSPLWGDSIECNRGKQLMEIFEELNLTVINNNTRPSFQGHRGESFIDLTAVNDSMYPLIGSWLLLDEVESMSDHKIIKGSFSTGENEEHESAIRFGNRKADWKKFENVFDRETRNLTEELELCGNARDLEKLAGRVNASVITACKASMPIKKCFKNSVPWWTAELSAARRVNNHLRRRFQRAPAESRAARKLEYDAKRNEYKILLENTRKTKWKEYCSKNAEKDPWGVAYRVIRGKHKSAATNTCVKKPGGGYTNGAVETIKLLLESFFPEDDANTDTAEHANIREGASTHAAGGGEGDRCITGGEIRRAFKRMDPRKAPGFDGITADAALHAYERDNKLFVVLYNKCLQLGIFPGVWKEHKLCFIPKPKKSDPTDITSFRPISLLPVLGKGLDRILTTRIEYHIKQNGGFHKNQYGFSSGKSTVDAIHAVISFIHDAKNKGHYCTAISLDIASAFDMAWWPIIISELIERGVPENLIRLTKSYFADRTARAWLPTGPISRKVSRGCPQGSSSGPTFWKILYDTIFKIILPDGCEIIGFADDTILLVSAKQYKVLKSRAVEALQALNGWATRTKLHFNNNKSEALFFGKINQQRPAFRTENGFIYCKDAITYLGVVLDHKLNWKDHIKKTALKTKEISNKIAAAARLTWGFRGESAALLYEGAVRPATTYACSVWEGGMKVREARQLLSAQRILAIKAARAYRTVSTEAALVLGKLTPIDLFIKEFAVRERVTRGISDLPPNLNFGNRQLEKTQVPADLAHPSELDCFNFCMGVESAFNTQIYTDGSRNEEGRAGGAFVVYEGDRESASQGIRLADGSSVFQCELAAIRAALIYVRNNSLSNCSIISDSQSALTALRTLNKPSTLVADTWSLARTVGQASRLRFHWAKAHAGNNKNERADELAKESLKNNADYVYTEVPLSAVKKALRSITIQKWNERWTNAETGRLTQKLAPELSVFKHIGSLDHYQVQLITGHGNFKTYLVRIGKLEEGQDECECGEGAEDACHLMFSCRLDDEARARADRRLIAAGLRWPPNLEAAAALCRESEWWSALREFAARVPRLRIDD